MRLEAQSFQTKVEPAKEFMAELIELMAKHGVESISIEDRTSNWGYSGQHLVVVDFEDYEVPG